MNHNLNEFTQKDAQKIGDKIGIDWSKFSVDQFRRGLNVELEHGLHDPQTNVTDNDPVITGKIAFAHLKELPNYYDLLEKMEEETEDENH